MQIRPYRPDDESEVVALWERCGLIRPWNDPRKDIARSKGVTSCNMTFIPKRQRRLHRPALKTLLAGVDSKAARNEALARAYLRHGYTLAEIGRAGGVALRHGQPHHQGNGGNLITRSKSELAGGRAQKRRIPVKWNIKPFVVRHQPILGYGRRSPRLRCRGLRSRGWCPAPG
jgi:hypothetical protein